MPDDKAHASAVTTHYKTKTTRCTPPPRYRAAAGSKPKFGSIAHATSAALLAVLALGGVSGGPMEENDAFKNCLAATPSCEFLDLSIYQLSGQIPSTIGQLTGLTYLKLNNGNADPISLNGLIPSTIGQLTALTFLVLTDNTLDGPIPSTIGQLTELNHLQLDYNQLSGPIPSTIGQITGLTALALALNSLTSYIPSEIGQLTNLKNLSLQGNPLCLPVPAEVDALAQYTYACTQGTCVETGPAGTAYIDLYAPPYLLPL